MRKILIFVAIFAIVLIVLIQFAPSFLFSKEHAAIWPLSARCTPMAVLTACRRWEQGFVELAFRPILGLLRRPAEKACAP
jgi:hypothetical protein